MQSDTTKTNEKIYEMIKDIKFAMITTRDENGQLCSCPLTTQEAPFTGDLWFLIGLDSPTSQAVQTSPDVNLAYANPNDSRYISVSGIAEVSADKAKAKELWKPAYMAWFPEGLEDPNLGVLKVSTEKAEYWDTPNGKLVTLLGYVKSVATGKPYKANKAEHDTVTIKHQ